MIPTLCTAMLALKLPDITHDKVKLCLDHERQIIEQSAKFNVDPAIVISVIYNESKWEPNVISRQGACGLMQAIPKWVPHKFADTRVTCQFLKIPNVAIYTGIMTLNHYSQLYTDHDLINTLCSYNTGDVCKTSTHKIGKQYAHNIVNIANKIKLNLVSNYLND